MAVVTTGNATLSIKIGGSIHDEIVPYLEHKLSKNKWKSKQVAKQCRNRQARSNRGNRHHRHKRYYHQSHMARKGIVPSSDFKNLKSKRRSTNDTIINESVTHDINNTNQKNLEETLNYYTFGDNEIDPKLLVLQSPKRRRRRKNSKKSKQVNNDNDNDSSSFSLSLGDDLASMSLFTSSEDSNSVDDEALGYYYVPNNYSKYDKDNNDSSSDNDDDDSSSSDDDNWNPWPSNLPDPKNVPLVPAPPKPVIQQIQQHVAPVPAPVKKPKVKKIVAKEDVDQFPHFKIEDELKLLEIEIEQEKKNEEKENDGKQDNNKGDEQDEQDEQDKQNVATTTQTTQTSQTSQKPDTVEQETSHDNKQNTNDKQDKNAEKEKEKEKERETKEAEMKEICLSEKRYCDEIGKIEELNEYAPIDGLAKRSSFKEYNKEDETTQMDPKTLKKVFKEIKVELPKNIVVQWNGSMFVRFDEENPRFLQALLTGLDDTPYENGLFLFDIYLHKDYPNTPLKIKHVTKGGNMVYGNHTPGGFSPNLHRDSGKVCLSLLGTWGTNQWDPKTSNIYQVLSSILFWIFGAKWAYYMEPSYGGWELTAPMSENDPTKHTKDVITYNYEVIEKCMKYAILETIRTPYTGFDQVTKIHFKVKKYVILKTILTKWIKDAPSIKVKNKLIPLYKEIKEELNKL